MNLEMLDRLTFSIPEMDPDRRLRELILYISEKCESDPRFGLTKLNKILLYADFISYFRRGRPITGAEYMRLPNGPAPRRMKAVLSEMQDNKSVAIRNVPAGKFEQQRVVPLARADRAVFTLEDIELVDEVIRAFWESTAKDVSLFSHGTAWKVAAENKAPIPYQAVFLSDDPIDKYDVARTAELNRRFKWVEAREVRVVVERELESKWPPVTES